MPGFDIQRILSQEILSPHIEGLNEAVKKLSEAMNLKTSTMVDEPLQEVYIDAEVRNKVLQAPPGKQCWLSSPAPVIKRNGVEITEGFTTYYLGGAVVMVDPQEEGTYTVSADYVNSQSLRLEDIEAAIAEQQSKFTDTDKARWNGGILQATATYNATNKQFTLTLVNPPAVLPSPAIVMIAAIPNDFHDGDAFKLGSTVYTPHYANGSIATGGANVCRQGNPLSMTLAGVKATLDGAYALTAADSPRTLTHTKSGTVHALVGLPTTPGLYTCQFIAAADFIEGDTWADGYTAKPTGEDTALPDKAFVAGDLVGLVVDVAGKRLGFKLGGGAAPNVFLRPSAPPTYEGIWLKAAYPLKNIVLDDYVYLEGTWENTDYPLMPNPSRTPRGVAVRGQKVHLFGGYNGSSRIAAQDILDVVTKIWSVGPADTNVENYGYNRYAYDPEFDCIYGLSYSVFYKFTFATGQYQNLTSPPYNLEGPVMDIVGDWVIMCSGSASGNRQPWCMGYNRHSGLWTTFPSLPQGPRDSCMGGALGGELAVYGGYNGNAFLADTRLLNPYTGTWRTGANVPASYGFAASKAVGGQMHLIGGGSGTTHHNYHNIYSKADDVWSVGPIRPRGGYRYASIALESDHFLLFGGYQYPSTTPANIDRYNIQSKSYPENTVVILVEPGAAWGRYVTELISSKKLQGLRNLFGFGGVWFYHNGDLLSLESYYGDSAQWREIM